MNTDKIFADQLANEYAPKDTSKVVALKKLDKKAKNPANIFAFSLGTISALIFGVGMCLTMGQIGSSTTLSFVAGTVFLDLWIKLCYNHSVARRASCSRKRQPDKTQTEMSVLIRLFLM